MSDVYVIDASVGLKWVVEEELSHVARPLIGKTLHAPALFLLECGNALWRKVRQGDMTKQTAQSCMATLENAPLQLTADESLAGQALSLSIELGHPVYDCAYLALAIRHDAPMVTADRRIVSVVETAAPALARHLLPLHKLART